MYSYVEIVSERRRGSHDRDAATADETFNKTIKKKSRPW